MTDPAADAVLQRLRLRGGRRLPVVLQTEAAECALACLAMVASSYGCDINLAGLRRRASISLKGAPLQRVIEIAAQLSLDARPLRLEMEELSELKTPCLLHWDLNHFVVLKKATAKSIVIHDPARGVQKLTLAEVSRH